MAQIGTIKLQTQNNGTVSVPVFDTGDSGSSVYEFVRVKTTSGIGFIPVVDPSSATYPYLRVQSQNQGVVAVHNDSTLINIIDNFEAGLYEDQGKSLFDNWTATSSQSYWDRKNNSTVEGNYLVDHNSGDSGFLISLPGDGLPNYPDQGDTFRADFYTDFNLNQTRPICWGVQGNQKFYYLNVRPGSMTLRIATTSSFSSLDSTSDFTLSTNTVYTFEVTWNTDNSMTATAFDENGNSYGTLSATDSTYTDGGVGFGYYNDENGKKFFDNFRIV